MNPREGEERIKIIYGERGGGRERKAQTQTGVGVTEGKKPWTL